MRVLMTGGGTGGHVNPAIAIANTIKENDKSSEIAFVGTSRGIENKLVPKFGYELYHVEIQGLKRSLSLSNIKTLYLAVSSVQKAKKLVRDFKPDVVIGTGGYVSWPVIKAAADLHIPTALHESNAIPGVAVKMLEKYVDAVYTNFESTKRLLKHPEKAIRVGNPLIGGFSSLSYDEAREKSGIKGKYRYFLLTCGGSMGAHRINSEVLELMKEYTSKHPEILHIHSAGTYEYKEVRARFEEAGLDKFSNIRLCEYIYDMPDKMAAADLVLSRAGAMTLSELSMLGKPCILIPSPNVTDNHQYKNAHELEKAGAAVLIEEKNLIDGMLISKVNGLLENEAALNEMSRNIKSFAFENTNMLIYNGIKELVKKKK